MGRKLKWKKIELLGLGKENVFVRMDLPFKTIDKAINNFISHKKMLKKLKL